MGPFVGLGSQEEGRALLKDLQITYPAGTTPDSVILREYKVLGTPATFYFTPSVQTRKVLHDASHLLVGIEHDGNTGKWKYLRWHLVDLARFKVRLKAEFQASNEDLYRPELIIRQGEAP